jgi:glycolate oxidase FAD binding subunit
MTAHASTALARLAGIAGAEHIVQDPLLLAPYAVDGVAPLAAVRPGSAEEVAEIVRIAATEKVALIPLGARTKAGIGAPPARYDLALDLARLDRVVAYDPDDLTLGVEAGIPLARLAGLLAAQKQHVPLAVPFAALTTVGGTIASGVDSPLRQLYGTARDFVLGIEFVTGEGNRVKSGGRVVKNVAGYDLHKLLIGSLGTLGVITRVNFRTFPQPLASRGFLASFTSLGDALQLRRRIVESPLAPLTLEILSPEVARTFAEREPLTLGEAIPSAAPWLSGAEWTLAAAFGGHEPLLARYAGDLARMAEESHAARAAVLGDAERPAVWGRLREAIPLLLEASPAATMVKMAMVPAAFAAAVERARQIAARNELPAAQLLRAAGAVYVALLPPEKGEETIARLARAVEELRQAATELEASALVEWCPAELKRRVDVWGTPRGDVELMRRLKKVFDPAGILSPGRFYGGI